MEVSKKGIELIKKFEGCRLKAYTCSSGVWTIGYGHTRTAYNGMVISQEQAEKLLMEDLPKYYPIGNFNQNEFDSLTSFAFNCGRGALNDVLNSGDITGTMMLYLYDSNREPVLYNRRVKEVELFKTPIKEEPPTINSYFENGIAKVICDRLNIRNMPSLQGDIQKEYYVKGEEINPYNKVHICDGFYWVEYERTNGQKGYCASRTIDGKEKYLECR